MAALLLPDDMKMLGGVILPRIFVCYVSGSFLTCIIQIIAINIPLAQGSIIALKNIMNITEYSISKNVFSNPSSNIQNTKGMDRWPLINTVAHAGPSSDLSGANSNSQLEHLSKGMMYLRSILPAPHDGHLPHSPR